MGMSLRTEAVWQYLTWASRRNGQDMALLGFFLRRALAAIGHGDAEGGELEGVAVGEEVGDLAVHVGERGSFAAARDDFLDDAGRDCDAADEGDNAQTDVGHGQPVSRGIIHQKVLS